MNMTHVVEWLKANVFIVVFALLMIAALVTLPLFSSGLNEQVRKTVNDRAKIVADVRSLEKTAVEPPQAGAPGPSQNTLVNEALLEAYRQVAEQMRADSDAVVARALEFNRKDHAVLMENVFPDMPPTQAEVLPKRFHEAAVAAYQSLLVRVRAGSPPDRAAVADELLRTQLNFISQTAQKDRLEDLTAEEKAELTKKLIEVRLAKNREQAERIGLYLAELTLPVPVWTQVPSVAWMFNWNWEYWVVEDILAALYEANVEDQTVLLAPVKRVLSLSVTGLPNVSAAAPLPSAMPGGMAAPGGRGRPSDGGSGASTGGKGTPAADQPTPPDPGRKIDPDYSLRFTGQKSNPLYDVLTVNLVLIVDSTRIPEVLDAIAGQNFFTVVDLTMEPVDPFEAAASGYMYGSAPVCRLSLTIDTVWLRQWTSESMPEETKKVLRIPLPQPAPTDA